MIDKTGLQTQILTTGSHQIAVKVVDNEGLESLKILKLKVNGEVKLDKLSKKFLYKLYSKIYSILVH